MDSKPVARAAVIQASIYALVVLLAWLLVTAYQVLLLVFGGILLAILLNGVASWLHRKAGIGEKTALACAILIPLSLVVLAGWLVAPAIGSQTSELAERLPLALQRLQQHLLQYDWISRIWQSKNQLRSLIPDTSSTVQYTTDFFFSTFGAAGNVIFVFFVGLFLAISPALYANGLLQLFPEAWRARAGEVLAATVATLRNWLIAKLTAMAVIGILTTLGLMLLGIDLALVLGTIAAVLSFIPNFGPIVSVIPAALIGLVAGPDKALYVLLLYGAIQAVESFGLTPLLQKRMVQMPPALLLTMQVMLGVLAGILGVIFATPLTAAAMVMVKTWYVEDLLGHPKKADGYCWRPPWCAEFSSTSQPASTAPTVSAGITSGAPELSDANGLLSMADYDG